MINYESCFGETTEKAISIFITEFLLLFLSYLNFAKHCVNQKIIMQSTDNRVKCTNNCMRQNDNPNCAKEIKIVRKNAHNLLHVYRRKLNVVLRTIRSKRTTDDCHFKGVHSIAVRFMQLRNDKNKVVRVYYYSISTVSLSTSI